MSVTACQRQILKALLDFILSEQKLGIVVAVIGDEDHGLWFMLWQSKNEV